jgi:quercetin dioxygenase-like cupin family protein
MVTVIKHSDMKVDLVYEPPMKVGFGVDSRSVENANMVMGYTIAPKGKKNQRHYHVNTSSCIYIVKGKIQAIIGPDHEKKELILEPGDFMFIPKGEIHGGLNLEDSELVFCYPEVSSKEAAKTIYIEPPHDE